MKKRSSRLTFLLERYTDDKRTSFTKPALHFDRAGMKFYQLLDDGETESGATVVATGVANASFIEAIPNLVQFMGRNARAGITHLDRHILPVGMKTHMNLPVFCKFVGVFD